MKDAVIILTGTGAVALMIAYYSIPFLILDGAGESLAKLRPVLLSSALVLMLLGFLGLWRAKGSSSPPSAFSTSVFLCSSVVMAGAILFPEAIAGFLANVFVS